MRRASGRQGMWLRQPAFNLTQQVATVGLYSDLIYSASDWERNIQTITQPKRAGGTRLESFNLEVNALANIVNTVGNFITPAMEILLWVQPTAFVNYVTTNTAFDNVLLDESSRVLWYQTAPWENGATNVGSGGTITRNVFNSNTKVLRKAKARLADQAIGLAVRLNFDVTTGVGNDANPLCKLDCWVTSP